MRFLTVVLVLSIADVAISRDTIPGNGFGRRKPPLNGCPPCPLGTICNQLTKSCDAVTCAAPCACPPHHVCEPKERLCLTPGTCEQFECIEICTLLDCKKGYACDPKASACVPVTCEAIDACPVGTCEDHENVCGYFPCPQFTCVSGCKDCGPGYSCHSQSKRCVPKTCEAPDACPQGVCEPSDPHCDEDGCREYRCELCGNVACGEGEECDPVTGGCVAVSCASPKACPEGRCFPQDKLNCAQQPCAQFTCSFTDLECAKGEQLNIRNGECVPVTCEAPAACGPEAICVDKIDVECSEAICPQFECDRCHAADCEDGYRCEPGTGACIPETCAAPNACGDEEECIPKRCDTADCDQFKCVNKCARRKCRPGYECDQAIGDCVPTTCEARDACPAHSECVPFSDRVCPDEACPHYICQKKKCEECATQPKCEFGYTPVSPADCSDEDIESKRCYSVVECCKALMCKKKKDVCCKAWPQCPFGYTESITAACTTEALQSKTCVFAEKCGTTIVCLAIPTQPTAKLPRRRN